MLPFGMRIMVPRSAEVRKAWIQIHWILNTKNTQQKKIFAGGEKGHLGLLLKEDPLDLQQMKQGGTLWGKIKKERGGDDDEARGLEYFQKEVFSEGFIFI